MKLIYLASPYSSKDGTPEERKMIEKIRFHQICQISAALMNKGAMIFSPIAHSHSIAEYGLPTDWNYWQNYCRATLSRCDEVWVVTMKGWQKSTGVTAEIELAKELGKPVVYVDEYDAMSNTCPLPS